MSALTLVGIVLLCAYSGFYAFILAQVYYLAFKEVMSCFLRPIGLTRVRRTVIGLLPYSFHLRPPVPQRSSRPALR